MCNGTSIKPFNSLKVYCKQLRNNIKRNSQNIRDVSTLKSSQNVSNDTVNKDVFLNKLIQKKCFDISLKQSIQKNVVIDFSSPNIAKPFHFGHLRSTIIGNFVANIHNHFNNRVTKINYLGDWGTQFGLLKYGIEAKNIRINELQNNPIKQLYEAYVHANKLSSSNPNVQEEARKYFSEIEKGKKKLEDWKKIRELTVQELERVYNRLGIHFDYYQWESDFNGEAIKDLMNTLEERNIITCDNSGKKVARIGDKNITVVKSDNTTLYLSRDIAALLDRYDKYNFDEMLYVVENAQSDHFAALFKIMSKINDKCARACKHIKFGRIHGMSTRSGNVIFLNDILDEAKHKMHEKQKFSKNTRSSAMNEETCDILGVTAVIINDLKQKRQKDYEFEWDKALQNVGDSGIKLQYLHCRLWNLIKNNSHIQIPDKYESKYLPEEIVQNVIVELAKFEDVLYRSLCEYEACIIVNYLFRLARYVNRIFNELKVKGTNSDIAAQRLLIFHLSRLVIKTGLEILGVKVLYEM